MIDRPQSNFCSSLRCKFSILKSGVKSLRSADSRMSWQTWRDVAAEDALRDSRGEVELREAAQTTHRLGNALQLVVVQEQNFQRIPQNHGKLYRTHCRDRTTQGVTERLRGTRAGAAYGSKQQIPVWSPVRPTSARSSNTTITHTQRA